MDEAKARAVLDGLGGQFDESFVGELQRVLSTCEGEAHAFIAGLAGLRGLDELQAFTSLSKCCVLFAETPFYKSLMACMLDGSLRGSPQMQRAALRVMKMADEERHWVESLRFEGFFECDGADGGGLELPGFNLGALREYSFVVNVDIAASSLETGGTVTLLQMVTVRDEGLHFSLELAEEVSRLSLRVKGTGESRWQERSCELSISSSRWHQVVISHSPAKLLKKASMSVHVDGAKVFEEPTPYPSLGSIPKGFIGGSFRGKIADPMLFAAALTSAQCDVLFRLHPVLSRLDRDEVKEKPYNDHAYAPWRRMREGGVDTVSLVSADALATTAMEFFGTNTHEQPTWEEEVSNADLPEVVFAYSARNSTNGSVKGFHCVDRLDPSKKPPLLSSNVPRVQHAQGGLCPRTRVYGKFKVEKSDGDEAPWMVPRASDDSRLQSTGSCAMIKCSAVFIAKFPPCPFTVADIMVLLAHALSLPLRRQRQIWPLGGQLICMNELIELLVNKLLRYEHSWTAFTNAGGFAFVGWVLSKIEQGHLSTTVLAQVQRVVAANGAVMTARSPSMEHRARCAREVLMNVEIWGHASVDLQKEWAMVALQCVKAQPLFFRLAIGIQRMVDIMRSPTLDTSLTPLLIDVLMVMLTKASSSELFSSGRRPSRSPSRSNSVTWSDILPNPAAKLTGAIMRSPANLGRLFRRDNSGTKEVARVEDSCVPPSAGEVHAVLMFAAGNVNSALSCTLLEKLVLLLDPLVMDNTCKDTVARGTLNAIIHLGGVDFLLGIAAHERETLLAKTEQKDEDREGFYGLMDESSPGPTRAAMLLLVGRVLMLTSGPVRDSDGNISPRKRDKETQERQRIDKQLGVMLRTVLPLKSKGKAPPGLAELLGACLKILLGGACDPSRPSAVELTHEASQVEMPEVLPIFGELLQALECAEESVQADARELLLKLSIVLKSSAEARTYMTDYPQWQRWLLGLIVLDEDSNGTAQVLSEVAIDLVVTLMEHDMEQHDKYSGLEELSAVVLGLEKERQRVRFESRLQKAKESNAKFLIPEFNALAERNAVDKAMRLLRLLMERLWTRLSLRAQPLNRLDSPVLCANLGSTLQMAEEILLHPMVLFKLSPLSPGGIISSSTSAAFIKNTALEPHGVRCLLDHSAESKWVDAVLEGSVDEPTTAQSSGFVANVWNKLSSTSLSVDDSSPWMAYRYPSTLVNPDERVSRADSGEAGERTDPSTRTKHRVVFYVVYSAYDLPELDPVGWSLYGRSDEDEAFVLLDRRTDVTFPSRYAPVACWVKQTGFFEEYKLVFDTSAKRKTLRDAATGERMVYKLSLGEVRFFECDVPNWHLDREVIEAPAHPGRNVELLCEMEPFILRALSTVEIVKGSQGMALELATKRAMLRLVCHVMMFSTEAQVIERCITLLQDYLAEEAELREDQALQRQNVLVALHAVAHCLTLPSQTSANKDLCIAMALAFVNTFSFDDDGTVAAAFMGFRESQSSDYLSQCLGLLEPLSRRALQDVLEAEVAEPLRRSFKPPRTSAAQRDALANPTRIAAYGAGKLQRPVGLPRNVRYRMNLFHLKERERRNNLLLHRKIWNESLEWKARKLLLEDEAMRYTMGTARRKEQEPVEERDCLWRLDTRYNDSMARIPLTIIRTPDGNPHLGATFSITQRTENNRMDWTEIGKELSKQTAVADVSKQQTGDTASEATHTDGEDELDRNADNADASSVRLGNEELEEEEFQHTGRKMTMEQWVNRSPSHMRGEWTGPWPAVNSGEIVLMAARCYMISPDLEIPGRLVVSSIGFYFDPDPPEAYMYIREDHLPTTNAHISDFDSESAQRWRQDLTGLAAKAAEDALKREHMRRAVRRPRQLWRHRDVHRVLLRRYRMRDQGAEVFMHQGAESFFLNFPEIKPGVRTSSRNRVLEAAWPYLPNKAVERSQKPGQDVRGLVERYTHLWRERRLSNFEYLMELNLLSGRSLADLSQYPVFPWVLSNYQGTKLDLSDPDNFRNLSLPMGALDADRLAQFQENYDTLDDPLIPKFFYGSHYSTMAGVVLYFLVRLEPFTSLHVKMQDGHFDYPDRLFTSVEQTWDMCTSNLSEVKELIPEFYCQPAFLQNINRFKFGTTQDRREVNDVLLPPWANGCAEEFVQVMRSALESEFVSAGLNNWIDLIFGHKQKGPAAVKAQNVFYYLTYPGAVDLDKISDPAMQEATVLQIAHFGQCPVQILTEPHVPRGSLPLYRTPPTLTAAMQQSFSFSSTFHGKRRIKLKQMFPQMYKSGKASPSSKSFVAAWSSDETIFACACPAIGVVDVAFTPVDDSNRELIVTFAAAATPITGLSLSNEFLVTAAADTDLCVWRLGSVGEDRGVCAEAFLRLFGHLSPILGVQVVQDRNVVVSVSQGSILVHSLYDGQLLKRYPVRNDVIVSGIRYNKYSGHISADLEDKEQIADLSIKSETLDP